MVKGIISNSSGKGNSDTGVVINTVSASGPDGDIYQDTVAVTVLNRNQLDTLLKAKWEGMKGRLSIQDVSGAALYYSAETKQPYSDIFTCSLFSTAATPDGMAGVLNYMFINAFMNIGAFAIVIMLKTETFKGEDIADYQGLSKTHPMAAALMLIFMFSLTGIPPMAGLWASSTSLCQRSIQAIPGSLSLRSCSAPSRHIFISGS